MLNIFKSKNQKSNIAISDLGKNNIIEIDSSIKFNPSSNISIGTDANNCHIIIKATDCESLNISILVLHGDYQEIIIDNGFLSWASTQIYMYEPYNKLSIGTNCMSAGCTILCGDSHKIISTKTNEIINFNKGINIGNHCWLGEKLTILKNVNLTNDIIVGAQSVVTKSFNEPFCAIAGNPAKIIKTDIEWNKSPINNAEKELFLNKQEAEALCKQ